MLQCVNLAIQSYKHDFNFPFFMRWSGNAFAMLSMKILKNIDDEEENKVEKKEIRA